MIAVANSTTMVRLKPSIGLEYHFRQNWKCKKSTFVEGVKQSAGKIETKPKYPFKPKNMYQADELPV